MKEYLKNIFRTILKNKASYIGAIIIITFGVFIFVAMADVKENLESKRSLYFEEYRFSDIFASVVAMPEKEVEKIKDIDGVKDVFGRLSCDMRLLLPDTAEIVTLHMLAYSNEDKLNKLNINSLDNTIPQRTFFVGNKMYDAYGFNLYDEFQIIVDKEIKSFILGGTVKGPEFIYTAAAGMIMPDNEIYDIACVSKKELENLLDKRGIITDIGITLENGYKYDTVKYEIEKKLEPYGLLDLTDSENQMSNKRLNEEITQLSAMATAVPVIFMCISVFMMYIVLRKIIEKERSLIGTMKAFGFSDRELLFTYMKQSILIGIIGGILSSIFSIYFGQFMFNMYVDFFNLPYNDFIIYKETRIYGTIIAIATSALSTYIGVKNILDITPAESMRQAAPSISGGITIPYFLTKHLNAMQRMSIRGMFRNKLKNFAIMLAVSFPFALEAVLISVPSVTEEIFLSQFTKIQTYDIQVSYQGYVNYYDAVSAFTAVKNIYNTEGIVKYPINVRKDNISQNSALIGLNAGSDIYRIMDIYNNYYTPPDSGVVVSNMLAEKLGVKKGDTVEISINILSGESVKIPVEDIVTENFGEACYINIDAIPKFFNITKAANSVVFKVENNCMNEVKKILSESKNVAAVIDAQRTLDGYNESMESMLQMMSIFSVLAIVTGIVVIHNILDISMRDRKTEFGTLTILGTSHEEIKQIVLFEQTINFIGGILLGIPISWFFKELVSYVIATDAYTIELNIFLSAYIQSLFICAGIMIVTSIIAIKNIKNYSLTDILKEREQ